MKSIAIAALAATFMMPVAAPVKFDMTDPKGVSGMTIKIDSKLEPVRGQSTGVSGDLMLDVENPEKSTGKIVVDAKQTRLGSQGLTDAMHQDWCLDVKKFPTMEFTVKKIDGVEKIADGQWTADVEGDFMIHGVTKTIQVSATVTHLPGLLKARGGMPKDGDLVRVECNFKFNRLDYGIAPDLSTDLIGNEVEIDLSTIGVAPK